MKDTDDYSDLTKEEKKFSCFMVFCGLFFMAGSLLLITVQLEIVRRFIYKVAPVFQNTELSISWCVLTSSAMITFAILSFMSSFNVRIYRNCVIPILVTKVFFLFFGTIYYVLSVFDYLYLLALFIDIPIYIGIIYFYVQITPTSVYLLNTYYGAGITPTPKMARGIKCEFFTDCEFETVKSIAEAFAPEEVHRSTVRMKLKCHALSIILFLNWENHLRC
jgi:hypothetical protein